ncbi:hypothetical protein K1719_043858 [Acacia pycnantha]|nr:hypothetical protein K1719_043858 [Acacia pycnantha]
MAADYVAKQAFDTWPGLHQFHSAFGGLHDFLDKDKDLVPKFAWSLLLETLAILRYVPLTITPLKASVVKLWLSFWSEVHYNSLYATADVPSAAPKKALAVFLVKIAECEVLQNSCNEGSDAKPNKEAPRPPVPCVGGDVMALIFLKFLMATTSSGLFTSLASAITPASTSLRLPAPLLMPPSVPPPPLLLLASLFPVVTPSSPCPVHSPLTNSPRLITPQTPCRQPDHRKRPRLRRSLQNMAAAGGENGYAPSHLPGGIPMYRDNLTAGHGLWPPAITSSQPASSTHQYLT